MHRFVEIESTFIALTVVMLLLFAIAVLIIIDHKARIPGEFRDDPFGISGQRLNHPVWAWMVSSVLWIIISVLLTTSIYAMLFGREKEPEAPKLLAKLDIERQKEKIRHFHNSPKVDPLALGKRPICYTCHSDYPHAKRPMIRTLLNMHTQYVGCMTCHTNDRKVPESAMSLRWLNYSGIEVKGKPFGTDVDPKGGFLLETDDYYSKIVAYTTINGKETLLEITEDAPEAQEFVKLRAQLSDQDMGAIKKAFHSQVSAVGRFCTRCHAPEAESFLPFRALGFSDNRITALTNVNIVGITQKYKEFYIPTIFLGDSDTNKSHSGVLFGSSGKPVEQPSADEMKSDPRAWWRKSFDVPPPKAPAKTKPKAPPATN
jgi:cytochrome c553